MYKRQGYQLLAPGDRIMVAMSGGKDSYVMFHLLTKLAPRLPFAIELVAVHLDQVQPGYDGAPLRAFLEASGQRFEILREDTYSVVTDRLDASQTYCSLCSRLRRGILYTAAERLGCNKIALGHHRDDSLETFLLTLFYSGKLQAMPARYRTDDDRFDVIRPLIECPERDIATLAAELAFPIIPCNLCGSQENLKRREVAQLMRDWERRFPGRVENIFAALGRVTPSHLMDRARFDFAALVADGKPMPDGDIAFDADPALESGGGPPPSLIHIRQRRDARQWRYRGEPCHYNTKKKVESRDRT